MTGQEHRREAGRLLEHAEGVLRTAVAEGTDSKEALQAAAPLFAAAQVHATLAVYERLGALA